MADTIEKSIRLKFEAAGIEVTKENVDALVKAFWQMPNVIKNIETGADILEKMKQASEEYVRIESEINRLKSAKPAEATSDEVAINKRVRASREILENTQKELELAKQRAAQEKETLDALRNRIEKTKSELSGGITAPSDYSLFTPKEEGRIKKILLDYNTATKSLSNEKPDTKAYNELVRRIEKAKIDFDTTVREALQRMEKEASKTPEASNVKRLESDIVKQIKEVQAAEEKAQQDITAKKQRAAQEALKIREAQIEREKNLIANLQVQHKKAVDQGKMEEARAARERIRQEEAVTAAKKAQQKEAARNTRNLGTTASSVASLLGTNGAVLSGITSITSALMSMSGVGVAAIATIGGVLVMYKIGSTFFGIAKSIASCTAELMGFSNSLSLSGFIGKLREVADYSRSITTQSKQISIAVDRMAIYSKAVERAGLESDAFAKRVSYLGKQLQGAYTGNSKEVLAVLDGMGLKIGKLMAMPAEERFAAVARGIANIKNSASQAQAAIMLFERSGTTLIPFFKEFDAKLTEAEKVLGRLPQVLRENSALFMDISNNMRDLSIKGKQFFAGFLAGMGNEFNGFLEKILGQDFTGLGEKLGKKVAGAFDIAKNGDIVKGIQNIIEKMVESLPYFLEAFSEGIIAVFEDIDWVSLGTSIGKSIGKSIWVAIKEHQKLMLLPGMSIGKRLRDYIEKEVYWDSYLMKQGSQQKENQESNFSKWYDKYIPNVYDIDRIINEQTSATNNVYDKISHQAELYEQYAKAIKELEKKIADSEADLTINDVTKRLNKLNFSKQIEDLLNKQKETITARVTLDSSLGPSLKKDIESLTNQIDSYARQNKALSLTVDFDSTGLEKLITNAQKQISDLQNKASNNKWDPYEKQVQSINELIVKQYELNYLYKRASQSEIITNQEKFNKLLAEGKRQIESYKNSLRELEIQQKKITLNFKYQDLANQRNDIKYNADNALNDWRNLSNQDPESRYYITQDALTRQTFLIEDQIKVKKDLLKVEHDIVAAQQLQNDILALQRELIQTNFEKKNAVDPTSLADNMKYAMKELYDNSKTVEQSIGSGFVSVANTIKTSFSDCFYSLIRGTATVEDAFMALGESILNSLVKALTDAVAEAIMLNLLLPGFSGIFGFAIPGFASGGKVKGGRKLIQVNENGEEYVVSAKGVNPDNMRYLEWANRGGSIGDLAQYTGAEGTSISSYVASESPASQPERTVKQITVRSQAEIRDEWKRGGLIEFVRSANLRRGWA